MDVMVAVLVRWWWATDGAPVDVAQRLAKSMGVGDQTGLNRTVFVTCKVAPLKSLGSSELLPHV